MVITLFLLWSRHRAGRLALGRARVVRSGLEGIGALVVSLVFGVGEGSVSWGRVT